MLRSTCYLSDCFVWFNKTFNNEKNLINCVGCDLKIYKLYVTECNGHTQLVNKNNFHSITSLHHQRVMPACYDREVLRRRVTEHDDDNTVGSADFKHNGV